MKRMLAVDHLIGHWNKEHQLTMKLLKEIEKDLVNALLNPCEMNFLKLLKQLFHFLQPLFDVPVFQPKNSCLFFFYP